MKKKTLEQLMEEICTNPSFIDANQKLSDEEKNKVDGMVRNFVQNFVLPLEELVATATTDPEVMKEIRNILQNGETSKKNQTP